MYSTNMNDARYGAQRSRPPASVPDVELELSSSSLSSATPPARAKPSCSLYGLDMKPELQKLRVLVAANGERDIAKAEALTVRFSNHPKIEMKSICDDVTTRTLHISTVYENITVDSIKHGTYDRMTPLDSYSKTASQLCDWADILVLVPIDADTLAKMLHGMTATLLLDVLRGWDVSKRIIMVPCMTAPMWVNPITKKQLSKIRRKWNWIRVMSPILWQYEERGYKKCLLPWEGFVEVVEAIKNQAELMTIGHDVDIATSGSGSLVRPHVKSDAALPPEIWSLIFEYAGDWEVAMALGVYTNLSTPLDWQTRNATHSQDELQSFMRSLEWTMLTKPISTVYQELARAPSSVLYLSSLCVKLIIKFCLTDLLTHLETNMKDVFWASFGSKLLPTKASAVYGRTAILDWWRTSPSFLKKDYTVEAIDGASRSGFVHVLDWWRKSGLSPKYTEAALEQASAKGHILVLEWWKQASMHQGAASNDTDAKYSPSLSRRQTNPDSISLLSTSSTGDKGEGANSAGFNELAPLQLMVGKSIIAAAQNGQAATIRWWYNSGIPFSHSDAVARIASTHGHVDVLDVWRELKGDKFSMSFDYQVLVGPTKNGFVRVLEWWRNQTVEENGGLRVEYKTCDIEEALEDSVRSQGGEGEDEVRKWWARNGLNLGVGTSEWMKVKTL